MLARSEASILLVSRVPDSLAVRRESGQTVYYVWFQACQKILGMLIGLSTAVTYCDSLLRIKLGTLKVRLLLSSHARARLSTPPLGGKPQYVTAVDKPINMPRISWQARTKRSIQFDQTLSLPRESLACKRLPFYLLQHPFLAYFLKHHWWKSHD